MASVAGPNTESPIIQILKANDIDPEMMVSREDGPPRSAFTILEAAIGAAIEEIEDEQ